MRTLVTALAGLISVAVPASSLGADGHALLQRGIALHREASYAASVAALEQARAARTLQPVELVECAFYLGASYVALGSLPAARRELRAVIETDPAYEAPPYTSPKVAAVLREVRDELQRAPRLKALPARRPSRNEFVLEFDASRTGGDAFGAARWRWRGEEAWREAPLGHDGDRLAAPLKLERNGTVEYWAELRAPGGYAQAGSAERPLELPVAGVDPLLLAVRVERPRRSVLKSWWLWTTVGAVAAAGLGVGLYFALRPNPSPTADAVLDFQVR
jgi:tetratricopeptide (TPR) repeat protein